MLPLTAFIVTCVVPQLEEKLRNVGGLDMGRAATWERKWLKPLMYPCMLVAALGFSLSLAAHIASIIGKAIPSALPVMDLHIGIFVVWFPAVLVVGRMTVPRTAKTFGRLR